MVIKPQVTVVDSKLGYRTLLRNTYEGRGYRVLVVDTTSRALEQIRDARSDIIVLDPKTTGISVSDLHHFLGVPRPLIVVSSDSEEQQVALALSSGADDYVTKPFAPVLLLARTTAVLRRANRCSHVPNIINIEGTEIDFDRRVVKRNSKSVSLTRTEWRLVEFLAVNPGRVLPKAEILRHIWGPMCEKQFYILRVCISRLRKKLEKDPDSPKIIRLVQGIGYAFGE